MDFFALVLFAFVQAGGPGAFDARAAEHLANRAGFGATSEWVEAAVRRGREAVLDELFAPRPVREPRDWENLATGGVLAPPRLARREPEGEVEPAPEAGTEPEEPPEAARAAALAARRAADRRQLAEYAAEWVAGMVAGEDPLRDRMTLFWHGHFTSSMDTVRSSHALIHQHRFLRENALGNFRALLGGILRDPAMLVYLDNHRNARDRLNENLAREFLELFTIGEGSFSETDVREVARCLTGHTVVAGAYAFRPRRHDAGSTTILGRTGRFDLDGLVDLVLEHPRTAEHIAWKLLRYFEGIEPEPSRVLEYASALRAADWELEPVLRRLFTDPAFERPSAVGARIASPLDFTVGHALRLGIEPPPEALLQASRMLGEWLFHPPSVKGWEQGAAWLSASRVLARANVAGLLAGAVAPRELMAPSEADGPDAAPRASGDPALGALGRSLRAGRRRAPDLAALCAQAVDDASIVTALAEALLAIEPPPETRAALVAAFARDRAEAGLHEGPVSGWGRRGPPLLARIAHKILASPEASLH